MHARRLAVFLLAVAAPAGLAQSPGAGPALTAAVEVRLPADAELWFQGVKMGQTGELRVFSTPPLLPGVSYTYDVFVRWRYRGQEVRRNEQLTIRAGEALVLEFPQPGPNDSVFGYVAIREVVPAPASPPPPPALGYASLTELAPDRLPPRRLPPFMSVLELDVPARPVAPGKPRRVAPAGTEVPLLPLNHTFGPGHVSIVEIDELPR